MTQGGHYVIIILPIKSKMAAAKKQCFFVFVCLFVCLFFFFCVCFLFFVFSFLY